MVKLLLVWIINAVSLLALPYIFSGIKVESFYTALIVALLLGLQNAIARPVLILLTLPLSFWFVSSFVDGFVVSGFWTAVLGAIAYSVISWACSALILGSMKD